MDNFALIALWLAKYPPEPVVSPLEKSLQRLVEKLITVFSLGCLLGGSWVTPLSAAWGRQVYVNTPPGYALNVRWGPGTGFGVNRKVLRGTSLQVTEVRRYGWLQLTDGTWVAGNLVSSRPVAGEGSSLPSDNFTYVVTPSNLALNIRSGPGTNYARTGQFLNGTRVRLSGRYQSGWAQLVSGNWVDNQYLQANYPDNARPTPTPQPTYDPNVVELQRRLIQLGYLSQNFVPNGIYDEVTQQAVREFQRVNGLPVNGVVDEATWLALYEATEPTPTPRPTPTPTVTPVPSPTGNPSPPPVSRQARVVTDGEDALIFAGPNPATEILRTVSNGEIVNTTGQVVGNWTELSNGGWIFSLYLEPL